MSSFRGLSIGISGLYANKRSLDTISHNIANSDNPLYVRQQALHADSRYSRISLTNYIGTGVDVQQIRQIRDEFLDTKVRKEASELGYWVSRSNVFDQVEGIVRELSEDAMQGLMDKFWGSWEEVYKTPGSQTARGLLRERAIEFVGSVNHMYTQLESLQFNLDNNIKNIVDEVNYLTNGIAELNTKIMSAEAMGVTANDYRDTRNGYLDRLSQIVKVDYYTSNNGAINVAVGGAHIVSDGIHREIEAKNNGSPFVDVFWKDTGEELLPERDLKSGELIGLLYARGYYGQESEITDTTEYKYIIPTMKKQLDEYVKGLSEAINEIHSTGKTLTGNTGIDFFVKQDPSNEHWAGNIKLNDVLDSLDEIAASESGDIGDGKIAEAIAKLRYTGIFNDGKTNPDNFYRDIITDFGIAGNEAITMSNAHEMVVNQIDDRRSSLSGVSLDEEMTEMIKFQHAYNANARLINAIDEMIEQIVNKMGIVGR
ncbi:flagellar hook-associated protein FlgK [Proteiniborus sp. MB09-C3]|uniref:flagellar hook-associated protein FlgK n=1 Tax=Proteiniborus sp. MB09-C3 TaxID=3050072 RepID=UPI0025565637|nr:flagellar hook-associated protein FlgK [Proteiniborus sp. MB09-C3]WIV12052.1 flagellar hook-associated protein FlgK [Proteiniborus sp. MB09-C3]